MQYVAPLCDSLLSPAVFSMPNIQSLRCGWEAVTKEQSIPISLHRSVKIVHVLALQSCLIECWEEGWSISNFLVSDDMYSTVCPTWNVLGLDVNCRFDLIAWMLECFLYGSRIWSAEYIDMRIARISLCRLSRSAVQWRITLILTKRITS